MSTTTDTDDGEDVVGLPSEVVGEHVRQQALLDSDPRVLAPEGAEVDEWDVLQDAEFQSVEYVDGDLHAWFETETRIQEKVARATHWQPAEYRNHYCRTHVSIVWDYDPESRPTVEIEVEHP